MLSFELNDNQIERISEFLGNFSILNFGYSGNTKCIWG